MRKDEYRYRLETGSRKVECPQCGKRRAVPYIDVETGQPLPSKYCRCDRENDCRYHLNPYLDGYGRMSRDEWRAKQIENTRQRNYIKPKPAAVQPSFIDAEIMRRSLKGYERNTLLNYLCSILDKDKVMRAVERYRIGTTKTGATVYYQIDNNSRIRTGKAISYKSDGHRDHSTPPTWVHKALKYPDYQLEQCLFGLHLLKGDTTLTVGIVEAEKTALIASIYLPEYVWLATGGVSNFGLIEKCADSLKGLNITLFPDLKATQNWQAKSYDLKRRLFLDITVSELLEHHATEQEREQGLDLADFLLR